MFLIPYSNTPMSPFCFRMAVAMALIVLLSKLLLIGMSVDSNLIRRVVVVVLPLVPVMMTEPSFNSFARSEIASTPAIFEYTIP